MQSLILGFAALIAGLLAVHWYRNVNTVVLARSLRMGVGMAALIAALVLIVRGAVAMALPLAMFGLYMLLNGPAGGFGGARTGFTTAGQTSRADFPD